MTVVVLQALALIAALVFGLLAAFKVNERRASWLSLFAVCTVVGVWAIPIWKLAFFP